MSMRLAINDVANNCAREGATGTITLKSGATFTGKVEQPPMPTDETVLILTETGWATVAFAEIAAIESRR